MRYVAGYTADPRGSDAVNLAVAMARRQGATLDLVMVMPQNSQYNGVYPHEAGFETILAEQVSQWLDEGLALIPEDIQAQAHIRSGESEAEELIAAAEELGASLLIIGGSNTGIFKRFSIGAVANSLLHASTIPVVLAPAGYSRTEPITRLTCALGTRAGAEGVLQSGIAMAKRRSLPLRLVSLVAVGPGESTATVEDAKKHLLQVAATGDGASADVLDTLDMEIVVGTGRSIEDAVDNLKWKKGEILLIGSSRLAQNNSIFLGSTANRILRALPVPMIVVPRNYVLQAKELFPTTEIPVIDAEEIAEAEK
ncbi:universal stress protein [Arthrobacter sp. E3]|uniref:universal stress protein n=1 Tax=Arthrobacter sp. E3 TaxID=517402 RepID=UPI001A93B32A|nr:universal stress protein [Arthrobacter sp. E3]